MTPSLVRLDTINSRGQDSNWPRFFVRGGLPFKSTGRRSGVPTRVNDPVSSAGAFGSCVRFDRASSQRIDYGTPAIGNAANFTVIGCVNIADPGIGNWSHIVGSVDYGAFTGWAVQFNSDPGNDGMRLVAGNGAALYGESVLVGDITVFDEWTIFAASFNQATQTSKLYLGGRLLSTDTTGGTYNVSSANPLSIGDDASGAMGCTGRVAWVALFDSVLPDPLVRKWMLGIEPPVFDDDTNPEEPVVGSASSSTTSTSSTFNLAMAQGVSLTSSQATTILDGTTSLLATNRYRD